MAEPKTEIIKNTLKEISTTYDIIKDEWFKPIDRKTKLIDFDNSVLLLTKVGWIGIKSKQMPQTPDTVFFNGDEIVPVEIKWKDNENSVKPGTSSTQIKSLARKLATFVFNFHRLNNVTVKEYWIITNYKAEDEAKK